MLPSAGAAMIPGFAAWDRRSPGWDAPAMAAIRVRFCASASCASSWDGRTTWRSLPRPTRSPLRRSTDRARRERGPLHGGRLHSVRDGGHRAAARRLARRRAVFDAALRDRRVRRDQPAADVPRAAQHAGVPRLAQLRHAGSLPRELSRGRTVLHRARGGVCGAGVGSDRRRAGRSGCGSNQRTRRASLRPARPRRSPPPVSPMPPRSWCWSAKPTPRHEARDRRAGRRIPSRVLRPVGSDLPAASRTNASRAYGVCLGQPQSLGPVSLPAALAGTTAARLAHRLQSRDGFDAASVWEVA